MSINDKADRLRCALCRRGLLEQYHVYRIPVDESGASGTPAPYSVVKGYLFTKNAHSAAGTMEIAGELAGSSDSVGRMLAFLPECRVSDLIEVGGVFYRITHMRRLYAICCVLDCEVYPYENPN